MAGAPVEIPFNPNGFYNFSPYGTLGLTVNANGTSSSGAFTTNLSINANSVLVQNTTTDTVYVAFGSSADGAVTATLPTAVESYNSTPVAAGAILLFSKKGSTTKNVNGGYDTVAVLPGTAAGKVHFTAGEGA